MASAARAVSLKSTHTPSRKWGWLLASPLHASSDAIVAVGALAIVVLMILPVPAWVMDLFLTLNLSIGVVLLMAAVLTPSGTRVFTFPTILILTTLFRLALDISSTRLILNEGAAGEVIRAFGQFVAGGNIVTGFVVFLVITMVQLIVISKGAERTATANAVFVRESIAGRQAGIDADAHANRITSAQVSAARRKMNIEVEFFGRMYGAMEFIKGDAIAGLVISAINIIGGLIMGVGVNHMGIVEALETYTILTMGAGLVSQIPALIGSTAGTILVSRVSADEGEQGLGGKALSQFLAIPRALLLAAGMLGVLGLVPGMPTIPFLGFAACLGWAGYHLEKRAGKTAVQQEAVSAAGSFAPFALLTVECAADNPELAGRLRTGVNQVLADVGNESGILFSVWSLRLIAGRDEQPLIAVRRRGQLIYSGEDDATALQTLQTDMVMNPAVYFGPDEARRWLDMARATNENGVAAIEAVLQQRNKPISTAFYEFLKCFAEERIPINLIAGLLRGMLPVGDSGVFCEGEGPMLRCVKAIRVDLRDHTARYLRKHFWREGSRLLVITDGSTLATELSAGIGDADARKRAADQLATTLSQPGAGAPSFLVTPVDKRRVWRICEDLYEQGRVPAPTIVLYPEEAQATGIRDLPRTNI